MKRRKIALILVLGMAAAVTGCSQKNVDEEAAEVMPPTEETMAEAAATPPFVEREFWLAVAEEPGFHLDQARDMFLDGQTQNTSRELEKVAAMLTFETRHSHSQKEADLLLASAQELSEVSRTLGEEEALTEGAVSLEEFDRVSAFAFRALAGHQVALAGDALEDGDTRMAGLCIQETVKDLGTGFKLGGIEADPTLEARLEAAQEVGIQLGQHGEGSHAETQATVDDLKAVHQELTNVLTDRRK